MTSTVATRVLTDAAHDAHNPAPSIIVDLLHHNYDAIGQLSNLPRETWGFFDVREVGVVQSRGFCMGP